MGDLSSENYHKTGVADVHGKSYSCHNVPSIHSDVQTPCDTNQNFIRTFHRTRANIPEFVRTA